jgi:LPXTG-motif cell wall-anchored protein
VELDYACTFTSKPAYTGTNTATVTWDLASGVETHSDAVAAVGFENPNDTAKVSPRETDRVIDVTDAFDGGAGIPVAGLQDLDWVVVKALPGSVKAVKYTRNLGAAPGGCRTYPNVVRMFRDGTTTQVGLPADESVTVCSQVGPTLSNAAQADYDRSYAWDIAKAADGTTFATGDSGTAEVGYTVNATPGAATDSGWTMGGLLQVSNPNTYKSLTLGISLGTTVGGGAACSLTPGQDLVVPASGSRTYTYSCSFTGQPAYTGTATATVSWGGGTAGAEAPVAFGLDQETDRVVDVVDDQTVPGQSVALGSAEWNATGTPATFTYSLDLAAEANQCEDYTNTAEIVETGQSADATVTVCGPEVLPAEEVAPRPPVVKGVEGVLPSTGGPALGLAWAGLGMLLTGFLLMAARKRRLDS